RGRRQHPHPGTVPAPLRSASPRGPLLHPRRIRRARRGGARHGLRSRGIGAARPLLLSRQAPGTRADHRGEPLGGTGGGGGGAPPQNRSKGWGIASQRGEPLGGAGGGAAVAPPQTRTKGRAIGG